MAEDTVSGGTASVTIEGILVLNEESVKAAEERLAQITGDDVSTPEGRPTGGKKGTKAKAGAANDVQQAAGRDTYKLTLDGGHLRSQIMAALEQPFKITIDADVRGALRAAGVGAEHGELVQHGAPVMQRAAPDDLLKGSISKFGRTIDELHDTLSKATQRLGQTFGQGSTPLEKMADILEHFGVSSFNEALELQKTGGHPKVVGGRASAPALTAAGFSEQEAGDVENLLRSMTTGSGKNLKTSEANALFGRTATWMKTGTPVQQAAPPPQAQAQTAQAATAAGPTATAATPQATPALDTLRAADKTLRAVLGKIPFQEVTPQDLVAKYPVDRSVKKFTGKPLGEAEVNKLLEKWDAINQDIVNLDSGLSAARGTVLGTGEGAIRLSKSDRNDRMRLFAAREGIESQLDFSDAVIAARTRGGVPRPPRPDDDPEATARANAQLGRGNRANVRRGIGQFVPRTMGGINVDLEPLLKAARGEGAQQGEFQGLIQGTKTGKVARFVPTNEEEEARARARATSNKPFTIHGFGEQARNINPTEAFWDAVTAVYDEEITAQLRSDPEVANLVKASLAQGAAPRPFVDPKAPREGMGSGESGGVISSSAQGFERSYRAAYRLRDVLGEIKVVSADIEKRWDEIGNLQGTGVDTSRKQQAVMERESRLGDLQNRARLLARQADLSATPELQGMAGQSPEQRRILAAAAKVRDVQTLERSGGRYANANQQAVGEGVGLSEEELLKKILQSPSNQGRASKELGFDIAAQEMVDTIMAKFQGFDPEDTERDPTKRRRLPFGREDENSGQVLGRAFRETVEPFLASLPPKGQEKRLGEQVVSDIRKALFGEQQKVIQGVGDTAFSTTERAGGITRIANEEAERAAKLLEAGRGRGFVPRRVLSTRLSGQRTNAGGVEALPEYERPATALDTERQMLQGRLVSEAGPADTASVHELRRRAAEDRGRREAGKSARERAEEGARAAAERAYPQPMLRAGPNAPVPGALAPGQRSKADQEAYDRFYNRSLGSRLGKIPAEERNPAEVEPAAPDMATQGRLKQIDAIQLAANRVLTSISKIGTRLELDEQGVMRRVGGPDINAQRKAAQRAELINLPEDPYERERLGGREGPVRSIDPVAVKAEIADVLQTRTAGAARNPYTRNTRDLPTGDETQRRFDERGGMRAGEGGPEAPYHYQAKGSWETTGIAASAGTMHVIIAGQTGPVTVAMTGGGGGGGGGGRRRGGGGDEPPEEPIGPMFGPPVPPGLFPSGPAGASSARTAYGASRAAQRAFDKQYDDRDPLNTYATARKRPLLKVKRTAEEIGRQRMAREAEAEERRQNQEAERAAALTTMGTQPIRMVGPAGPRQSVRGQRTVQARQDRQAAEAEAAEERRNNLNPYGQPIQLLGPQGPRQSVRAQRTAEARATREAREAAAEATRTNRLNAFGSQQINIQGAAGPFQSVAEQRAIERRQAAAARATATAARQQAAQQRRDQRLLQISNPEELAKQRDLEDDALEKMRGKNRAVQRSVPRRGFGASLVDLVTAKVGGQGFERQLEHADRAQREINEMGQLGNMRAQKRTQQIGIAEELRTTTDPGRRAGLLTQQAALVKDIGGLDRAIKISQGNFEKHSAAATKATTVMRSFGAAAVGSTISTAVGAITVGLGMAVVAPIIQGVTMAMEQSIGPAIERASGFGATSSRVTRTGADAIRQTGGDTRGALAAMAAPTGIAAGTFAGMLPTLARRAEGEAGNLAIKDQLDLLHTQFNLAKDQGGRFTEFDKSIMKTTGGMFGGDLFGIPSTSEQVTGELKGLPSVEERERKREDLNLTASTMAMVDPNDVDGWNKLGQRAAELTADLAKGDQTMRLFNGQAEKGGSALRMVEDSAKATETAQLAAQAGLTEFAESLIKSGIGIEGAKTPEDILKFLQAINMGSITPSPGLLLQAQQRQMLAQIGLEDSQRQFKIDTVNPQTIAMAEAARPLGPAAAGIGFSKRDDPKLVKELNANLADTQKLYDDIATETKAGTDAAKAFVAETFKYDPKVGDDFAKSLDHVAEIGKQITSIEIGLQTKQAAYSAAQFAFSIDIAKRSLADAKGLVSGIGDSMGALERQIHDLQRQSQALSLGQSQRQINFQKAVAGFQAPGLSSEEAEARQEQAKTEAAYAQKQLDIQKKLFGLSGTQFNRGAARQVRDLERQLRLLEKGRELSLDTAVAEKRIIALTKIQAKENKNVETYYEAAVQRTADVQGKIAELVAATGVAMRDVGKITLDAFKLQYDSYIKILTGENPNPVGTGRQSAPTPKRALGYLGMDMTHAEGWAGTVNGATSFGKYGVAGEAGGEAVAILRDPKSLVSPMGGGGDNNSFTVIINNPIIRNDEDKTRLIADVKRAIQKEGSLLLPRRA